MARHTGGWVKFWRKAALGDINSNYTRGGLFGALIAMANIQESTVSWDGKPRRLVRGQICTSIRELADLGNVDPKTVSKHLSYLQLRETIKVEKCSTGTLITFVNYEQYAGLDAEGPVRGPRGMEDDVPAAWIHNEELKNKRKKEYSFADQFERLAEKYKSQFPETTPGPKALERFKSQIKSLTDCAELDQAIDNYRALLVDQDWRKAKTTFANFLGTKASGYFWREYIQPIQLKAVSGESSHVSPDYRFEDDDV